MQVVYQIITGDPQTTCMLSAGIEPVGMILTQQIVWRKITASATEQTLLQTATVTERER